jgi:hypothetical protein
MDARHRAKSFPQILWSNPHKNPVRKISSILFYKWRRSFKASVENPKAKQTTITTKKTTPISLTINPVLFITVNSFSRGGFFGLFLFLFCCYLFICFCTGVWIQSLTLARQMPNFWDRVSSFCPGQPGTMVLQSLWDYRHESPCAALSFRVFVT